MTLRQLPSIERLLGLAPALIAEYGRPLTLQTLRSTLDLARAEIRQGGPAPSEAELLATVQTQLQLNTASSLQPVINATGVILHTNLGRAPLSAEAVAAVVEVAGHYSTLEYDLPKGQRGSRRSHAEALLTQITGAEAALVVNNAASALLLALSALAKNKEVLVSRGQLVEIGGGFRVPDVMKQSGAKLVEVGATNRTHLKDYAEALGPKTAALLCAHQSNFKMIGFTSEPSLNELATLAHTQSLPLIHDLGSGALVDTARYGLAHEPTVQESLQAGASLVIFSGDKLLGGPQAGLIVGQKALVDQLSKHPLARAIRADKLTLAPLAVTLLHYLKDESDRKIPVWQMISRPLAEIESVAQAWARAWGGAVLAGQSTVGGGSLPGEVLPTHLAAIQVAAPDRFLAELRKPGASAAKPIIARVEADQVVFDPRTVPVAEVQAVTARVKQLLKR